MRSGASPKSQPGPATTSGRRASRGPRSRSVDPPDTTRPSRPCSLVTSTTPARRLVSRRGRKPGTRARRSTSMPRSGSRSIVRQGDGAGGQESRFKLSLSGSVARQSRRERRVSRADAASGETLSARGQRCEHLREVTADLGTDLRAHGLGGRPRDLHPIGDARTFVDSCFGPYRKAEARTGWCGSNLRG